MFGKLFDTRLSTRTLRPTITALFVSSTALLAGCMGSPENNMTPPQADCSTPQNLQLTDIASVVDWINALPKPTSLPCFLESLPRPLNVNFTQSVFSAQPSLGARNPRVFITYDKLQLSVVTQHDFASDEPGEEQIDLLELGYITTDLSTIGENDPIFTIKGELKFPIKSNIPYSAPYDLIAYNDTLSVCAFCHAQERLIDSIDNIPVYESHMYKPFPSQAVTISSLLHEHYTCDSATQEFRCDMLSAIFDHGDVIKVNFPENARYFE